MVRAATEDQPGPSSCPPDRLFVPAHLRSDVLQWGHASRLTCHPSIQRTRDFLQQRFWWSSLEEDVQGYFNVCPVCNQNKTSCHLQAGFLHPLPVPHRPWSHISLDFVTGLPTSKGHTVILTVVDRFSKMAHFIPLSKLPSAKDTAKLVLQHIFGLHGLPTDIVSDRGPQFTSMFWKEFCNLVGASVSLFSGFHPQSNRQTERMNQDLETILCCLMNHNPASWSEHPHLLFYWTFALPMHLWVSASTICQSRKGGCLPISTSLRLPLPAHLDQARTALLKSADRYAAAATSIAHLLPPTRLARRSGSPHVTCP